MTLVGCVKSSSCCIECDGEGCIAGRVGFGKDMGATRSLRDSDTSGQAMEATAGALLEADRRLTSPVRKYQFWRKVCHLLDPLSAYLAQQAATLRCSRRPSRTLADGRRLSILYSYTMSDCIVKQRWHSSSPQNALTAC